MGPCVFTSRGRGKKAASSYGAEATSVSEREAGRCLSAGNIIPNSGNIKKKKMQLGHYYCSVQRRVFVGGPLKGREEGGVL